MINDTEFQQALHSLHSARDCLRWAESCLRRDQVFLGHGTDDPWDEALALLLHVLHLPWETDPRMLDARLLPLEVEAFATLLRQRINKRVPAAYLTGEAWFCGLPFNVDRRVLIPRSPIAELIEAGFQPFVEPDQVTRVLDLCTGSGCIAIACAYAFPEARIEASDISPDALAVCETNIARHDLQGQVRAIESDGFAALEGLYDLIVSNPPYVDAGDFAGMPEEFRHEPALALTSGDDGLDFTRRLLREAADYLTPGGVLVCEVGNSGAALEAAFPGVPFFWLEFERGGHGVFLFTREQLVEQQKDFAA